MWDWFRASQAVHALLVILAAIGFFRFCIRTRFWFPRYVHYLAGFSLAVGVICLMLIPPGAPINQGDWRGVKKALTLLVFPALVYFFFVYYGGQGAAYERAHQPKLVGHQEESGLRVVGAGLFVFSGVLVLVAILGSLNIFDRAPSWVLGSGIAMFMLTLLASSHWLFNRKGSDPFGRKSQEEHIRELEQLGLLESTEFRATRAFGVEEFEDEGLHYFAELADGRVLFLSGQYLYDYEPISDDPDVNQPREFPCSEFTLRRHKEEGYVVEIRCGGTVLEPEVMAPPFGNQDWRGNRVPEDGQVISDARYDDLKGALLSGAGGYR